MTQDYTPKSLHEAFTWLLDLPLDAPASDIAVALADKIAVMEGEEEPTDHPDSHKILVKAIGSPSESEIDALTTLLGVAMEVEGEMESMPMGKKKVSY